MGEINWENEEQKRLVHQWLRMAKHLPPELLSWGVFVAQIKRASANFQHAGDSDESRFARMRDVVIALNDFLNREAAFADDPAARSSLMPLLTAIHDVQNGRKTALFQPFAPSHRPPLSAAEANTAGAAARAMTELMATGDSLDVAASKAAKAVRSGKCAGHERCTPARVKGWRNRIHEGDGSIARVAIQRYHAPRFPKHVADDPESRATFLLDSLRYGEGFR